MSWCYLLSNSTSPISSPNLRLSKLRPKPLLVLNYWLKSFCLIINSPHRTAPRSLLKTLTLRTLANSITISNKNYHKSPPISTLSTPTKRESPQLHPTCIINCPKASQYHKDVNLHHKTLITLFQSTRTASNKISVTFWSSSNQDTGSKMSKKQKRSNSFCSTTKNSISNVTKGTKSQFKNHGKDWMNRSKNSIRLKNRATNKCWEKDCRKV